MIVNHDKGVTVNKRLGEERWKNMVSVLLGFSGRDLFESQLCIDLIQLDIRFGAKLISEVHFTLSCISSSYERSDIRGNLENILKIGIR